MRVLIVSDTHNCTNQLLALVERCGSIDAVIHAGDGENDIAALRAARPDLPLYTVTGNCDFRHGEEPELLRFTFGGVKFFLAHGHRFGVKYGYESFIEAAQQAGADVAVFGHTHRPVCERIGPMWLVNPGALALGCFGYVQAAFADITPSGVLCHAEKLSYKR